MRVVLLASLNRSGEAIGALLEARGHEVIRFCEAKRALRQLEVDGTASAFIVLDSGNSERAIETCWDARLLATFERPIYIGLVARPMPSQAIVEALDCGVDDVLQMPLSSDELYARLRSAERMNQMQLQLVRMATRDALTGLLNRSAFFNGAEKICRAADAPSAAIMADIDHFKAVNDRYGHAVGDKALKAVAACLGGRAEIVARLGGEEFVLLLPASGAEEGRRVAEGIRAAVAAHEIDLDGAPLRVTCSFGVAVAEPGATIDEVLRRADAALYAAKRDGRDRVAVYRAEMSLPDSLPASVIRRAGDRTEGPRRQAAGGQFLHAAFNWPCPGASESF
ncbi:diguanylate cyclase [Rhodoblastus sp.]|uniref:GGDEF domain-containing protein n=1 Tax=Rhodoblastus sp. TaxID=1962975 RepID=UPI0026160A3E|nr:diguanylate cyclase [Rhodoblastus sp.]